MSDEVLEFSEVYSVSKGALNHGRLRMQREKITFKASRSGKIETVNPADVEEVTWMRAPKGFEMALVVKSGMSTRLQGFKETDGQRLQSRLKKWYQVRWTEVERSVRGLSYGRAEFRGSSMKFLIDDKPSFDMPLASVCQTSMNKNEVHLEFHPNDEADVQLTEMRFYVPPTTAPLSSTSDSVTDDKDAVKEFHSKIASHADILRVSGDALIAFDEMSCLVPRGRYTVKVYPAFLFLHGKTFDFTVPFQSIVRLFLLPHNDARQMYFVVSMDPPIRQGQTRYPFLILLVNKEETMEAEIALSEEEVKAQFGGKLTKEISGPIYEVLSRVMKAVASKKIIVPGSYKSQRGGSCISCSYKANHGMLFPLEKGFIFVHKPALHVRFDEVVAVNFSRGGTGASRSFDFELEVKNNIIHIFQSMDKDEYSRLYDFCSAKKLRIRNKGGKAGGATYRDDFDDDDSDHDNYLEKMKAEGAMREDDTDSDDSDYQAGEGSGDESAGDLEFDSDAVLSDDDENAAITIKEAGSKKSSKPASKPKATKESKPKEAKAAAAKPPSKKFISAEEVNTSEESGDESAAKPPPAKKAKKADAAPPTKKKPAVKETEKKKPAAKETEKKKKPAPEPKEDVIEDSDSEDGEEEMEDVEDVPAPTRSMRSRRGAGAHDELAALPSDGSNDEDDAELTSGASDEDDDGDDDESD